MKPGMKVLLFAILTGSAWYVIFLLRGWILGSMLGMEFSGSSGMTLMTAANAAPELLVYALATLVLLRAVGPRPAWLVPAFAIVGVVVRLATSTRFSMGGDSLVLEALALMEAIAPLVGSVLGWVAWRCIFRQREPTKPQGPVMP